MSERVTIASNATNTTTAPQFVTKRGLWKVCIQFNGTGTIELESKFGIQSVFQDILGITLNAASNSTVLYFAQNEEVRAVIPSGISACNIELAFVG